MYFLRLLGEAKCLRALFFGLAEGVEVDTLSNQMVKLRTS